MLFWTLAIMALTAISIYFLKIKSRPSDIERARSPVAADMVKSCGPEKIVLPDNGEPVYAGMGDYELVTPNGKNKISLPYSHEPPFGDSLHNMSVNGVKFPVHVWGCGFAVSSDSNFFVFSWKSLASGRETVVLDIENMRYFRLPQYIYKFRIQWPEIIGFGDLDSGKKYSFSGNEEWEELKINGGSN